MLYTEDYYFFLSSTSGWNRDYFILKSNHFFSNIELVDAVGKNISNIHSGYGTHIYYESNDRYYDLNVINGNKKELDSSSLEASLIKNRVEYKAFVGVEFGDCKRKDSTLTFSYFNKTYSLG